MLIIADNYSANTRIEVREGTHTADRASVTVAEAGKLWIEAVRQADRERSTIDQYQSHLTHHILPHLGRVRLSRINAPLIREFEDKLRRGDPAPGSSDEERRPRSQVMTKKILGSLSSLLSDAQERGLVSRNVARDLRSKRKRGKERQAERRQKGKLKIGVDIPTREEIRAIVVQLQGRWRPIILTAIFTGLRASELRGLRWEDVDFSSRQLHVRQRADKYNAIGAPKSEAGERTVPLTPIVLRTLREWKLACPRRKTGDGQKDADDLWLVFPTGAGEIESHANILQRGFMPAQVAAGVTVQVIGEDGKPLVDEKAKPIVKAKYTGLHAVRHFYASWCINRRKDGGLELPPKSVQERLGHSSIVMTLDTYGHLFPRGDDSEELAEAEQALLA